MLVGKLIRTESSHDVYVRCPIIYIVKHNVLTRGTAVLSCLQPYTPGGLHTLRMLLEVTQSEILFICIF